MSKEIFKDMFNMICGNLIGSGAHRKVYEHKWDKSLVIKVEFKDGLRSFSNVKEAFIYSQASDKVKEWLAPIEGLSPDGHILFQKRCEPLPLDYVLPDKLPAMFNDIKNENFGLYKNKLVCLDYEIINMGLSLKQRSR